MTTIKIKANDTFIDGRTGLLHAGQEAIVSQSVAEELEKLGLVTMVSEKTTQQPPKENKPNEKPEVKKIETAPANKMMNMFRSEKK